MNQTRKLTTLGMLGALSILLVAFIHFPIFPQAPFLEYDGADIPILIAAFIFGPIEGIILTVAASIVQGITVSAESGYIGIIMHIFATGAFVAVSGIIFKRKKSTPVLILALLAGVIAQTAAMIIWNIIFTPIFMNTSREVVMNMIVPIIMPFNIIKSGINAIAAFILFSILKNIPGLVKKD